jgi:hypothetical protein
MCNRDRGDQWAQLITEVPGIGRGFQHHGVGWAEMVLTPVGQILQVHPARSKDHLLPGSDRSSHHVVLMHVQSYKPFSGRRCEHRFLLFVRVRQTSSQYVVVGFAVFIHRFGLRSLTLPVKRIRRAAKHPTGLGVPPCKRANPDATYPSVPVSFT